VTGSVELVPPRIVPPLDAEFRPFVLTARKFRRAVIASGGGMPLVLGLERGDGARSRHAMVVFPDGHPQADSNLPMVERVLKFLLWQKGAFRVHIGGPAHLAAGLARLYSSDGERGFDAGMMGETIYDRPFEIVACAAEEVPDAQEGARALGRHLDGCRIGFDLGASDRKVSAVRDGKVVFSEEVVWDPRGQSDPGYHYAEIMSGLCRAADHLPRVDAIGGSAAGVYVDDRVRVASLFRGVPQESYGAVRDLFVRIRGAMGVPLVVVNDGEVTALAGSMSLEDGAVLGVALGSSQAAGYVTREGNITSWLNELAFAPVDLAPTAPVDEWSGDRGVGALYFSQQCVFRLAPQAGIDVPDGISAAERLQRVQAQLDAGHEGAQRIWETMGVCLGYAIAQYADFYDLRHVLILGRCTSGRGGAILVDEARRVLLTEFPDTADQTTLHLPDERTRRVGQAIAAASLPALSMEDPR